MTDEEIFTMDSLVQRYLALDPRSLRDLGGQEPTESDVAKGSISRRGLNVLLRRALHLYVTLLPHENATIRLETEASAKAAGWPDARTANLALLLVWGLVGVDRRSKGLPRIPLLNPGATVTSVFQSRWPVDLEPSSDLVRKAFPMTVINAKLLSKGEMLWKHPVPVHQSVPSTNALIQNLLRLDPLLLATGVPWYREQPAEWDVEAKGHDGLHKLLRDVLIQFNTMKSRATEEVRLMGEHDARDAGRPDAHSANVATLLSAGLMCEDGWEVLFLAARPYSQAREDLLRAMALEVVRSKSMLAQEGFRLICEDMVHHGVHVEPRKASRLMDAADAELETERTR